MKSTDYELLRLRKIIDDQLEEIGYLKRDKNALKAKLDEYIERYGEELEE